MTNHSGQYAIGSPTGDRVFAVTQSGAGEWRITDGEAHGVITAQWEGSEFHVDVEESSAEAAITTGTMWDAVRAFARLTRTVEATTKGRDIARNWQSPGTVGNVLAQFASTGRARLDLLTEDAERTMRQDSVARPDMSTLLTVEYGYREPISPDGVTVDRAVFADAQAQIVADVRAGTVPADVEEFSDLHDYVDANMYGRDTLSMDEAGPLQDALDYWIRSGGIADALARPTDPKSWPL